MSTITAVLHRHLAFVSMLLLATIASHLPSTHSFAIPTPRNNGHSMVPSLGNTINTPRMNNIHTNNIFSTKLHAEDQDSNDGDGSVNPSPSSPPLGYSEAAILGVAGVIASNIMFYSESVLFRTGHGLPGGGLVGVVEGFSYLFEVGLAGFSVYTMISTGKGLTPGPRGILLAATRLSYLAVFAGVLVLIAQAANLSPSGN